MYNSQNNNNYDPWGSYGYDSYDPTSYDYTYYKGKKGGAQVNPARAMHSSEIMCDIFIQGTTHRCCAPCGYRVAKTHRMP